MAINVLGPPELLQELTALAARALKAEHALAEEIRIRHLAERSMALTLAQTQVESAAAQAKVLELGESCSAWERRCAECALARDAALAQCEAMREREVQVRTELVLAKSVPAPAPDPTVGAKLDDANAKLEAVLGAVVAREALAPAPMSLASYALDMRYDGAGVLRSILATPA